MSKKAIRYNVCKKIAQLYKVIELLESTNVECDYQIEVLNQHYNLKIANALASYTTTMQDLLSSANVSDSNIEGCVATEFNSKYESMKSDFDAFIATTAANLDQLHVREATELESMSHEVDALLAAFLEAQRQLDTTCADAKSRLKSRVDELDVLFQQQALAHDDESQRRIEQLKRENTEKLKALHDAHAQALLALKTDPSNFDFAGRAKDSAQSLRQQVQAVKSALAEQRAKVADMLSDAVARVKSAREAAIGIVKETSDGQVQAVSLLEELNAELKLLNENNYQAIAALRKSHTDAIARQRVETQQKMDEYARAVARNNEEVAVKNVEMRSLLGQYETDAEAIAQRHKEEIEEIARRHEKEVKDASAVEERLHKDLMNLQENLLKVKQSFRRELAEEELDTKRKLEEQERLDAERIDQKKAKYKRRIGELELDIVKSKDSGSENEANLRERLEAAVKERDELEVAQRKRLEELEADHIQRMAELRSANESSLLELEAQQRAELEATESAHANDLNTLQCELDREFDSLRESLGSSNGDKLSLLQRKLADTSERDRLVLAFTVEYNKALETLGQTQLPQADVNKVLAEMDAEVAGLERQAQGLQMNAAQQKMSLIENWEMKMRNESSPMSVPDSDTLNWSAITEKQRDIDAIRQQTTSDLAELNGALEKLKNDHNQSITALTNILALAQDQSELEERKKELDSLAGDRSASIDIQRRDGLKQAEELKARIVAEEGAHQTRLRELDSATAKAADAFRVKRDDIEAQLEKALNKGKTETSESNAGYEVDRHNSMLHFKEQMLELKEQLELLEQRRDSQAKSFNERLMSLTDNFNYEYKTRKTAQQEEMRRVQTQWREMTKFYDDRISILESARDKTRGSLEMMPSRESELDEMRRLDSEARLLLDMLQKAVKDLTEYRWMLTARDRDYSSRFGKGPAVGIYDLRSPRTPR